MVNKTYKTDKEISESNKKLCLLERKRRHREFNKFLEEQKLNYMQTNFDMLNTLINNMDKTIKRFTSQVSISKEERERLRKQIQLKDYKGFEEEHFKV